MTKQIVVTPVNLVLGVGLGVAVLVIAVMATVQLSGGGGSNVPAQSNASSPSAASVPTANVLSTASSTPTETATATPTPTPTNTPTAIAPTATPVIVYVYPTPVPPAPTSAPSSTPTPVPVLPFDQVEQQLFNNLNTAWWSLGRQFDGWTYAQAVASNQFASTQFVLANAASALSNNLGSRSTATACEQRLYSYAGVLLGLSTDLYLALHPDTALENGHPATWWWDQANTNETPAGHVAYAQVTTTCGPPICAGAFCPW
jgi:hypothetical protein